MITKKHFWKCVYLWIRYYNYQLKHYNQDTEEVWLAHKQRQTIKIFRNDVQSAQEIRLTKERIQEHREDIANSVDFEPQNIDIYCFTNNQFVEEHLNEHQPIKLTIKVLHNDVSIERTMPNYIMKRLYQNNNAKHTTTIYKQKSLNQSPIEKHMIKFSPVTYTLIGINVIIWLLMILFFNRFSELKLLDVGGLVHFNVVHGEWYRLISSIFLHYNFEHILMNMLSLFIFGKIVESIVGHWRMLVIFLFSGLFANFASLSFNIDTISVGASGAIFGLIGSLFGFMYISKIFERKLVGQLLIALVILIGISLFMDNINVWAHIGGFIGGLFITLLAYYFTANRNVFWILLVLILILFIASQIRIYTIKEDNIYNTIIAKQMKEDKYKEAKQMVAETIDKNYADDETYYLKGLITTTVDSRAEAISDWERGLKTFPDSGLLNYELAVANRALDDKDEALKYINAALKLNPGNENYQNLKKELED